MYVENPDCNKIGIIGKQNADATAKAIEANREKGREFLRQMGEDDSDEAVDRLIEECRGK